MNTWLFLCSGLLIGYLLCWLIRKLAIEKNFVSKKEWLQVQEQYNIAFIDKSRLEERLALSQKGEQKAIDNLQTASQELERLVKENSALVSQNRFLQEKLDSQKQDLEQIGQRFEKEFQLLAGRILEEKTEKFNQLQASSLQTILDPLKTSIKDFRQEFESKLNNEAREKGSLSQQIKQMMELNQNLSAQADSLTKALSNNVKQQGDWGEEILESILQFTGLQKDIQYFVQSSATNASGETIRPDVVVQYPDGRALVIDSKVSLLHYTRYSAATEAREQEQHLAQLVNSIRQHINGLDRKNYQSVTDALDLIMMFVPNEAAYITAMQADTQLWQYAYNRRVVLISPTNLIPAMKLVADMWQKDGVNRNAMEIAEKAGKLYDKLAGFIDNFDKIGTQLEKANETWHEAQKQLWKGRGNLLSQAEQMKKLQVKTGKQLPKALVEQALVEDGIDDTNEDLSENDSIV